MQTLLILINYCFRYLSRFREYYRFELVASREAKYELLKLIDNYLSQES